VPALVSVAIFRIYYHFLRFGAIRFSFRSSTPKLSEFETQAGTSLTNEWPAKFQDRIFNSNWFLQLPIFIKVPNDATFPPPVCSN